MLVLGVAIAVGCFLLQSARHYEAANAVATSSSKSAGKNEKSAATLTID